MQEQYNECISDLSSATGGESQWNPRKISKNRSTRLIYESKLEFYVHGAMQRSKTSATRHEEHETLSLPSMTH